MLIPRIVPCLDVRDGRVVKGVRFQGLRDAGDPATQAARYAAEGADEIVVLDVSATASGRAHRHATLEAVRETISLPLTAGGGVRTLDDARELLRNGADKVSVNSAAVRRPALLTEMAESLGRQCVVLAIDAFRTADGNWRARTVSGTQEEALDAVAWAEEGERRGAGEILLTSFDRDGTHEGYDIELLTAVRAAVRVPVIASGGASTPAHMQEALEAGADAVLAASIFHDGQWTIDALKRELESLGVEVRR